MFVLSLVFHLLVAFILLRAPLLSPSVPVEQAPVYVDVVTLPVASPQAGTPAPSQAPPSAAAEQAPEEPAAVALSQPKPPAAKPRTTPPHSTPAPAKKAPAPPAPGKAPAQHPPDEGGAFEERMAKLAQAAEARRMDDVMGNLRKKSGGKVGMPGGKGTEAGSDYSSYIQSRLRDAFRATIAFETRSPRVVLRLTIGSDGRVMRYRLEQSSGDRVFEEAVDRAVHLAERSFRPPPAGGEFEQGFVFRPQGVGVK